jgi:hypothetical protein
MSKKLRIYLRKLELQLFRNGKRWEAQMTYTIKFHR